MPIMQRVPAMSTRGSIEDTLPSTSIKYETQVLVLGGGTAGVSPAVSQVETELTLFRPSDLAYRVGWRSMAR